jgi:hypothetical protein
MDTEDPWEAYGDDTGSTVQFSLDAEVMHGGAASLRVEYDVVDGGWGDFMRSFDPPQDWSSGNGISLWLRSDGAGQPLALVLLTGEPENPAPFMAYFDIPQESVQDWTQLTFAWTDFELAGWADTSGPTDFDATQAVALGLNFGPGQGVLWVDEVALATGEIQPLPEQAAPTAPPEPTAEQTQPIAPPKPTEPAPPTAPPEPTEAPEPTKEPAKSNGGGPCASAVVLPLAAIGVALVSKRRN